MQRPCFLTAARKRPPLLRQRVFKVPVFKIAHLFLKSVNIWKNIWNDLSGNKKPPDFGGSVSGAR
jgi:hypothetical protein